MINIIRISEGIAPNTDILSCNHAFTDVGYEEDLIDYLSESGHQAHITEADAVHPNMSRSFVIEPPISRHTIDELGAFCVKLIDASKNPVFIIDDRPAKKDDPTTLRDALSTPKTPGLTIARCV